MQTPEKNILVIGHEAGLTGAPILLLHLLQLLKNEYSITIILKRGGALEDEFRGIAKTLVLKSQSYSQQKNILKMLADRFSYLYNQFRAIPLFIKADFIFSNTICNGRLLHRFRFIKRPVITYVHELESVLQYYNLKKDTHYSLIHSEILLFPSFAVQENIFKNYNFAYYKTQHFPYYFPPEDFNFTEAEKIQLRKDFRKKWNIPENSFLIAGMGIVSERKGTDKFIETAKNAIGQDEHIYFIWIGDFDTGNFSQTIKNDYSAKKYPDRLIFTGKLKYAASNLLPFDLFFLSSVEDPYPLVVLEAAYQQVPTVCFRNSGGIVEFLKDGTGYILNDDTPKATAQFILNIKNDKKELNVTASKSRDKVISLHSDKNYISAVFGNLVNQLLKLKNVN